MNKGPANACSEARRIAERIGRVPLCGKVRRETRRRRNRGVALPVVLALASMTLTTSAAWFETAAAAMRRAANLHDYLQAFHAADAALVLCARALRAGDTSSRHDFVGEPAGWKRADAFDAPAAFAPLPSRPGSVRAPQCLIEERRLAARPLAQAYLVTARGFGSSAAAQAWLQLEIVFDAGAIEQHWRRVVARPL
jgi:Tfp pilus assembly protein PilX